MRNANTIVVLLVSLSAQLALAAAPPPIVTAAPQDPATAGAVDGQIQVPPFDGTPRHLPRIVPEGESANGWRRTAFKVHPVPMAGGMFISLTTPNTLLMVPLELEYAATPNLSVHGIVAPVFVQTATASAGGITVEGGARFYLFGRAPDGFWLGGQVGATMLQGETAAGNATAGMAFDVQPQLGYQWVLSNGLTLGIGGGLSLGAAVSGQLPVSVMIPIGYAW